MVLALVAVLPLVAWLLAGEVDWSPEENGPLMHVVERGEFLNEIVERGNIESASNVEIRCEVKSRGQPGTIILWIVPEGTFVKPGDKLVELDSSSLDNERIQQQIVCHNSKAAVIKARNDFEAAKIAKKEYLDGTYKLELNRIQMKKFTAGEAKRQAEQTLQYSKGLAKKGYVTELRVETDEIAVQKADNDLEAAELEEQVLREFTRKKMLNQLDSNIATAEARLASEEASHKLDVDKLELTESQIEKCTIKAEEAGQVVYANQTNRRGGSEIIIEEGTMVRENQVIIRLPDPKRMQVKAKINEAKIAMVETEMPVTIRMDAFPDVELEGVVEKVNEYPAPTSWFAGNIKEYETFVKILGSPTTLKPGLTAEVRIRVEQLSDVLQVPVQAVFEHGGLHYCVMRDGKGWKAQPVTIGSTNDKFVVIREGLEPGQQVVLGAFAYRDEVDLPEVKEETEGKPTQAKRRPSGDSKKPDKKTPGGPAKKKERGGKPPGAGAKP